jgi:hypothetical protein
MKCCLVEARNFSQLCPYLALATSTDRTGTSRRNVSSPRRGMTHSLLQLRFAHF